MREKKVNDPFKNTLKRIYHRKYSVCSPPSWLIQVDREYVIYLFTSAYTFVCAFREIKPFDVQKYE